MTDKFKHAFPVFDNFQPALSDLQDRLHLCLTFDRANRNTAPLCLETKTFIISHTHFNLQHHSHTLFAACDLSDKYLFIYPHQKHEIMSFFWAECGGILLRGNVM